MKILPSRKMETLPDEIIIEQLRYLPFQDLLSMCSTNRETSRICRGRRLWEFRLMDDFKVKDLSKICDPRSYYFDLVDKRSLILEDILENITEVEFDDALHLFEYLQINSYQDFVDLQRKSVHELTGERIEETTGFMRARVSAVMMVTAEGIYDVEGFFFDNLGDIILVQSY